MSLLTVSGTPGASRYTIKLPTRFRPCLLALCFVNCKLSEAQSSKSWRFAAIQRRSHLLILASIVSEPQSCHCLHCFMIVLRALLSVQHASNFLPHVWLGQPLATVHSTFTWHIGTLRATMQLLGVLLLQEPPPLTRFVCGSLQLACFLF